MTLLVMFKQLLQACFSHNIGSPATIRDQQERSEILISSIQIMIVTIFWISLSGITKIFFYEYHFHSGSLSTCLLYGVQYSTFLAGDKSQLSRLDIVFISHNRQRIGMHF